MGRQKKTRYIQMAPHFDGFAPLGCQQKKHLEPVILSFEEYEAINLCDYELLSQLEAACIMNVSRPTLTRIYESARRKVARALVEGCEICFEQGNVSIAKWYECEECAISFTITENSDTHCPFCKTALNIQ